MPQIYYELFDDESEFKIPGIEGCIAARFFKDGTITGIEPMLWTNRICVAYAGTTFGCWDDMWCFEKDINVIDILRAWNPHEESEPKGWKRHPPTGRYRPDGDPEREYVKD